SSQDGAAQVPQAQDGTGTESTRDFWPGLRRALALFVFLCVVALVLLIGTVIFLLWRAKQLVATAVTPDLPKLEQLVEQLRTKHPALSTEALTKKIILRQANRAGLVGLATGIGGLPALPLAIPIDIAFTVKLQSNLVHLLRIVHSNAHSNRSAEEVSESSLWLITSGSHELTAASGVMVRDLLVKYLSKSLLKFLPLIGGLVGFALNWLSTQALGRLTLKWLNQPPTAPKTPA
ncbi:MAG: hypothetical protein AAF657_38665, partial [Acidobacteriota bacterium]